MFSQKCCRWYKGMLSKISDAVRSPRLLSADGSGDGAGGCSSSSSLRVRSTTIASAPGLVCRWAVAGRLSNTPRPAIQLCASLHLVMLIVGHAAALWATVWHDPQGAAGICTTQEAAKLCGTESSGVGIPVARTAVAHIAQVLRSYCCSSNCNGTPLKPEDNSHNSHDGSNFPCITVSNDGNVPRLPGAKSRSKGARRILAESGKALFGSTRAAAARQASAENSFLWSTAGSEDNTACIASAQGPREFLQTRNASVQDAPQQRVHALHVNCAISGLQSRPLQSRPLQKSPSMLERIHRVSVNSSTLDSCQTVTCGAQL